MPEIVDAVSNLSDVKTLKEFDKNFPDPFYYSIGIYFSFQRMNIDQVQSRELVTNVAG